LRLPSLVGEVASVRPFQIRPRAGDLRVSTSAALNVSDAARRAGSGMQSWHDSKFGEKVPAYFFAPASARYAR
jgi:hypothetical protein